MKDTYTAKELAQTLPALQELFEEVLLFAPNLNVLLDPATLKPVPGAVPPLPSLDSAGRALMPAEDRSLLSLYQAVSVEGRPCILLLRWRLPAHDPSKREDSFLLRTLNQYRSDLQRDYLTGAYNVRFMHDEYRYYAEQKAMEGERVGMVLVSVDDYGELLANESDSAVASCLNTAAGILRLAIGPDVDKAALARMEDGIFLIVTVGTPVQQVAAAVREALGNSRKEFALSLSRRGHFTTSLASADWAETANWDMLVSLALQRLSDQ